MFSTFMHVLLCLNNYVCNGSIGHNKDKNRLNFFFIIQKEQDNNKTLQNKILEMEKAVRNMEDKFE